LITAALWIVALVIHLGDDPLVAGHGRDNVVLPSSFSGG
jgi:hypothetical protein